MWQASWAMKVITVEAGRWVEELESNSRNHSNLTGLSMEPVYLSEVKEKKRLVNGVFIELVGDFKHQNEY